MEDLLNYISVNLDKEMPDVVVGSSRGGAIATAIQKKGSKLVLIAPAWKMYGVTPYVDPATTVLHCLTDDIVPFDHSIELAEKTGAQIIECGECHRMSDEEAIKVLIETVSQ